jgi:aldose 1-epimerase
MTARVETLAPSGEQMEISHGDQRATIVEVGGGLRSYTRGGRPVLDGYEADAMCPSGRGQVLIPWPNRVRDGSYEFGGRQHQLPLTEPERQNAIHGLVRWAPWTVTEREPSRVVLEHLLHPSPGYPFTLQLEIEYTLSDEGLHTRTTAINVGAEPCPYGAGTHPYLTVGTTTINAALLGVPAHRVLASDARGIPVGASATAGSEYDFLEPRPIGATVLDHAFTDLERDSDGLARVTLRDPGTDTAVALWMDEAYSYVMVFTGDPLPDVGRRSLAVEPMTCPPNAFRSKDDVAVLEPGSSWEGTWGITPR